MSRIPLLLVRAFVGVALLSLLGGIVAPRAVAAPPLRVLLMGDSLTQGFDGDYTWRYRFYKEFVRQGVPVDFVGSRNALGVRPGYTSAAYIDPHFDRDHFAQGGSSLGWLVSRTAREVSTQRPDIIVMESGLNDLRAGVLPAEVNTRLRRWINTARAAKPDVKIVVSPVLDTWDPTRPWLSDRTRQYDALAAATVKSMTTEQSPVTLAGTTHGWTVLGDTAENTHPNATGETLIAQRIAETFHTQGYLPKPITMTVGGRVVPSIYKVTAWNRQPRITVVIKRHRAVLSWDRQAITGARVWTQRVGHAARFPARLYGAGTLTTAKLAPRATYLFRVQLIRGRMVTPLGPVTRVVLRTHRTSGR